VSNWPDELRLAAAVALNVVVFLSSLRAARRLVHDDAVQSFLDAFVFTYLVQYVAVGLPGLLGILSFGAIAATALLLCALMSWIRGPAELHVRLPERDRWILGACVIFVIAEISAAIAGQRYLPPMANDALTYHLPAAVTWLQTGKIGLFETWFHNPANTYSPLAGSMFMAWLIAPVGNDALARFTQAPAMVFLMLGMIQLCRALGATVVISTVIATAAVLSRPFVSQSILAKDDLFVAAFFASAAVALAPNRLGDRLGAWRVGISLGLLLATKYTVLMSVPLLLLMSDAPLRSRWRATSYAIAFLVTLVIAAPWYVRNIVLTGNPLFPTSMLFFDGQFATRPSDELATAAGAWKAFVTGYYSATIWLAAPLVLLWVIAVCKSAKQLAKSPLLRTAILGPPMGILLFVLLSPYAEIRFVYPSMLLLFACGAIVAMSLRWGFIVALSLLLVGAGTGFIPQNLARIMPPALAITFVLLMLWWLACLTISSTLRRLSVAAGAVAVALACAVYVYWEAYLRREIDGYEAIAIPAWRGGGYGELADAWEFIRALPPQTTVAYTNTSFVYPLYGFDLSRRVVYVPTRAGLSSWRDLPRARCPLAGEEIEPFVHSALSEQPERGEWLRRLLESDARYLFVALGNGVEPPELSFAADDPAHFARLPGNDAAAVFEIVRP
jgi:hypothetical protein